MWTDTTRAQYARADLALPSDLTDAEWAVLEPLLPGPCCVGRPRKWPLRRIIEAILYLLRGGLPWRMLPPCFPPVSTVRRWFYLWRDNGLWLSLNHALLLIGREALGREASPSAGVIDSQSVKTTESGGPCGYDAGKKIKGRKRHIVTDTEAMPVDHALSDAAPVGSPRFFFRGEGFAAEMELGPSGDFVVRSGSKARVRTTTTIPRGTTALRNTLLDKGVLRQEGDFLVFTSDYSFSSASAAAATVIGASANGRILWKLPDGRTYADWETAQGNAPIIEGEMGDLGAE